MPRYRVTGAGLGRKGNYRTKAREADRWKIAPASLPFFVPCPNGLPSLNPYLQSCRFVRRADFRPQGESPY